MVAIPRIPKPGVEEEDPNIVKAAIREGPGVRTEEPTIPGGEPGGPMVPKPEVPPAGPAAPGIVPEEPAPAAPPAPKDQERIVPEPTAPPPEVKQPVTTEAAPGPKDQERLPGAEKPAETVPPPEAPTEPEKPEPPPTPAPEPEEPVPEPEYTTPPDRTPEPPKEGPKRVTPEEVVKKIESGKPIEDPEVVRIQERARQGQPAAQVQLANLARDTLHQLGQRIPSLEVTITRAENHRGGTGETESGINVRMRFEPEDRHAAMTAASKFAASFGMGQVHVRQLNPEGAPGQRYEDGSFNTLTVKWKLKPGTMSSARAQALAKQFGTGFSVEGDTMEAYYAGDPANPEDVERFGGAVTRISEALGPNAEEVAETVERYWPFGGAGNPIPDPDSFVRTGPDPVPTPAARRLADNLNRISGATEGERRAAWGKLRTRVRHADQAAKGQRRGERRKTPEELTAEAEKKAADLATGPGRRAAVLAMQPVALAEPASWEHPPLDASKSETDAFLDKARDEIRPKLEALVGQPFAQHDTLSEPVFISGRSVGKLLQSPDPAKIALLDPDNLRTAYEASLPVSPNPEVQKRHEGKHKNETLAHTAVRINIGNTPVIAEFTTKKTPGGKTYLYSFSLWDPPGGNAIDPTSGVTQPAGFARLPWPEIPGAKVEEAPPAPEPDVSKVEQDEAERGPLWASALARQINELGKGKTDNLPPMQWWNTIRNAPGVRKDELEYVELERFLKQREEKGDKKVSKQEIINWVFGHALTVEEQYYRETTPEERTAGQTRRKIEAARRRGYVEDIDFVNTDKRPVALSSYEIDNIARAEVQANPDLKKPFIKEQLERYWEDARNGNVLDDNARGQVGAEPLAPGERPPVIRRGYRYSYDFERPTRDEVKDWNREIWELYDAEQAQMQGEQLQLVTPEGEPLLPKPNLEEIAKEIFTTRMQEIPQVMEDINYSAEYRANEEQYNIVHERLRGSTDRPQRWEVKTPTNEFYVTVTENPTDKTMRIYSGITNTNIYEGDPLDQNEIEDIFRKHLLDQKAYLSQPEEAARVAEEERRIASGEKPAGPTPEEEEAAKVVQESTYKSYQALEGGTHYTDIVLSLPELKTGKKRMGHYQGDNVVAHVRYVRTTNDKGEPVLMILEIQSDYYQAARDFGFIGSDPFTGQPDTKGPDGKPRREDELQQEVYERQRAANAKLKEVRKEARGRIFGGMFTGISEDYYARRDQLKQMAQAQLIVEKGGPEEWAKLDNYDRERLVIDRMQQFEEKMANGIEHDAGVEAARTELNNIDELAENFSMRPPRAPLGTTWNELVFSRMIRYAADRGIKYVAWAPGEFHTDQWSTHLRQNVSKLEWRVEELNGVDTFIVKPIGGPTGGYADFTKDIKFSMNGVILPGQKSAPHDKPNATLEKLFGKDVAAKMRASIESREPGSIDHTEKPDLSVAGAGFNESYNKIYKKAAENVIKRLGGGSKVTAEHMGNLKLTSRTRQRHEKMGKTAEIDKGPMVWVFEITPEMQKKAKQGIEISFMAQQQADEQRGAYPGERIRDPAGVPDSVDAPKMPAQEVVKRFKRAMDLILRKGVIGQKRTVRGTYTWKAGVARVRNMLDITDVLHEGGHALHERNPGIEQLIQNNAAEFEQLAMNYYPGASALTTSQQKQREGFATLFHLYINNPQEVETNHPVLYQALDDFLLRKLPRLHGELMRIRRDVNDYLSTPSRALTETQVVSGRPETAWENVTRNVKDGTVLENSAAWFNQVYKGLFDNLHPITVAVRMFKIMAERNVRAAIQQGTMTKAEAKAYLAKLDLRGRANPIAMAQLARNGYVQGQDWLMNGVTDFNTGMRVSPSLSQIYIDLFNGRTKFIRRSRERQTKQDFDTYLVMRTTLEEIANWERTQAWIAGGKVGPEPPVLRFKSPTGQTRGDVQQTILSLETQYPHFRNVAGKFYKFTEAVLKYRYDAGIITKEQYEGALKLKNYAPMRRKMDDRVTQGTMTAKAMKSTGRDDLLRRRKGSNLDIISPMESAANQAYEAAAQVRDNQTKQALVSVAKLVELQGPGSGLVLEQIPAHQVESMRGELLALVKGAQNQLNVSQELDDLLTANSIDLDTFIEQLIPRATEATIWGQTLISGEGRPIMFVRDQGKVSAYYVNDAGPLKGLHEAMTAGPVRIPPDVWEAVAGKATAVFRGGVTLYPSYAIANAIRDTVQYAVFYPGFIPGWTTAKGMWHVIAQDRVMKAYLQANGMVGGANAAALDTIRVNRELKALRKRGFIMRHFASWRDFAKIIEISETGSRVGVFGIAYRRARRDGLNETDAANEAAFTAQDIMNFGRHGSNMTRAKRFLTFLNANLQALDKQTRVLSGGEGGLALWRKKVKPLFGLRDTTVPMTPGEMKALRNGLHSWAGMVALALVSAAFQLQYEDDDEYQSFSPYLRATRWMVKWGDTWVAIPKPYSLAIVANAMEAAMEQQRLQDPTAWQRFRSGLLDTIVPPMENPLIKTIYEQLANKNIFTGRDIVSDPARPNFMEYDAYTSELSKWLAKMIAETTGVEAISPQRMDHIITTIGASWGRAILRGSDFLRANAPTRVWEENPFTSYFIKDWTKGSTMATSFYELVGQESGMWAGAYNAFHSLIEAGTADRAQELLDMYDDNTKAYVILKQFGNDKEKRLHPIRRAETVAQVINEISKEILMGNFKTKDGEEVVMRPGVRRAAMDTLAQLRLREFRNALAVVGVEGWAQKKVLNTTDFIEQLRVIQPEIVEEITARMGKRAYPFETVRKLWPDVKDELLAHREGDIDLTAPRTEAVASSGDDFWTEGDGP